MLAKSVPGWVATTKDEIEEYKAIDEDRKANLKEWSDLGILQRMVNVGERKYARHQEYLTEFIHQRPALLPSSLLRNWLQRYSMS